MKSESSNMILGCLMCVASLLCGSLNVALAGILGETKLKAFMTYFSVAWFTPCLPTHASKAEHQFRGA